MREFLDFVEKHWFVSSTAGYAIYNAGVQSMLKPDDTSSKAYRWLYGTLHILAMNFQHGYKAISQSPVEQPVKDK